MADHRTANSHDALEHLWRYLETHALCADAQVRERFVRYLDLLERAGRAMNLVGPLRGQALVETLLCDSLVPLTLGEALPGPWLDLGSGAGLPGVPLAIVASPSQGVVLVEPRERRFRFLGMALRALAVPGLRRVHGRIDSAADLPHLGLQPVGTAFAKAVLPIAQWLELGQTLVRPGQGRVVALCSAQDWPDGRAAAARLGLELLAETEVRWSSAAPRVCAVLAVPQRAQDDHTRSNS